MIIFGCLLAFAAAFAPRVILILAALFSERWDAVWKGDWVLPMLGIIFLPYTTIMYMLSWNPVTGITGWDWMWILMGVFLDFWKWSAIAQNRNQIPGVKPSQSFTAVDRPQDHAAPDTPEPAPAPPEAPETEPNPPQEPSA